MRVTLNDKKSNVVWLETPVHSNKIVVSADDRFQQSIFLYTQARRENLSVA